MSKKILSAWISFALSSMLFVGAAQKGDRKLDILEEDGRGMNAVHYRKRKGRKRELKSDQSWNLKNLAVKYPVASAVGSFLLGSAFGAACYFVCDSFGKKYNSTGKYHSPKELIDNWGKSFEAMVDNSSVSVFATFIIGASHKDGIMQELQLKAEKKSLNTVLISLKCEDKVNNKYKQFNRCAKICFSDDGEFECFVKNEKLKLSKGEISLIKDVSRFFDEKLGIKPRRVSRCNKNLGFFDFHFFVDGISEQEIDEAVTTFNDDGTFKSVASSHVNFFRDDIVEGNFCLYAKR